MNAKVDSTRTAVVDPDYYYQPIETCPHGKRVLLLTHGNVAVLGTVTFYTTRYYKGWSPLPKIPEGMNT